MARKRATKPHLVSPIVAGGKIPAIARAIIMLAQKKTGAIIMNAQAIFRRYCVVTDPIILLSYYIQKEIPLGLALLLKSIKTTSLQSEEHNLKATIFPITVAALPHYQNMRCAHYNHY